MRKLFFAASIAVAFLAGLLVGNTQDAVAFEKPVDEERPAYLIASWKILHPDQLKPFADAVIPLAQKAGWTPLAASRPEVLEGTWPDGNVLYVQKYTSLRALRDFWRSETHAQVIKLREGHVESDFVVAIEAQE